MAGPEAVKQERNIPQVEKSVNYPPEFEAWWKRRDKFGIDIATQNEKFVALKAWQAGLRVVILHTLKLIN